jgi:KDO II ethanolaminephosphotransferase
MKDATVATIRRQYRAELVSILLMSMYLGGFLNIPIFIRKYYQVDESVVGLFLTDALFTVTTCCFLLCVTSIAGRRVLSAAIIAFTFVSVIASYYMWFFDIIIGYGVVKAVFGTGLSLAIESMGLGLLTFSSIFCLGPLYFLHRVAPQYEAPWLLFLIPRFLCIGLLTVCLILLNSHYKNFRDPMADGRIPTNPIGVAAYSYVPINWMAASIISVANTIANSQLKNKLIDPMDTYGFYPEIPLDDIFVVVVIGESARYDHMSLIDYQRATTPLLDKETNVIGFKGASCNTSTKLSLSCMFVREGGTEDLGSPSQQYVYENHVFSVLKNLGFSIDLFSMQSEAGFYVQVNADIVKIREEIGAEASSQGLPVIDDMLLVNQMTQSISKKAGKHLVILHQKGSHFNYSSRYPTEFSKYKPDCKDMHCDFQAMVNSYDNSIVYTDYFLFSLLERLRDKKAFLLYASDHGESMEDGKHFHAAPKDVAPDEQFKIPVIMWASDSLLENTQFAEGFDMLKQHESKNRIVRHVEIFESLLGCLGINSDHQGIRSLNNWCSRK